MPKCTKCKKANLAYNKTIGVYECQGCGDIPDFIADGNDLINH